VAGIIGIVNRKELSIEAKISTILAIILFSIPYIHNNIFPAPSSPDYFAKNRPYLEPKLIVRTEDWPKIRFSCEITNSGLLPAENIRYFFFTPYMKADVTNLSDRRHLLIMEK